MNSNTFRNGALLTSVATVAAATAVTVATALPARATEASDGEASAVVLRAGLDVSLLQNAVQVPLKAELNAVRAPKGDRTSAGRTTLTVDLDGVDGGKPFSLLRADVAKATAKADARGAEGHANLVRAKLHVPGLPLLSLVEVEQVTSKAICAAGEKPVAESNLLGGITVLGKRITLTAGGTTRVAVPGVGEVSVDYSRTETTSRTAAAAALRLRVSVNPLELNVAKVTGEVTLAEATCRTPTIRKAPAPAKPDVRPQTGTDPVEAKDPKPVPRADNLAETGGSSTTPYLAGGALLLLVAGGATVAVARSRRG
ncbi:SCO1860 family LAETG-anchored protein [Streptomyces sp. NPDC050504]|uniref:SCO1860 family LAETG-anchored protein n=1 Tax=Streptomyces sp. NPDC050504 TaxID=3365618 RepID=UPI0037ADC2B8